jgi:AcrR family transcriptional regulator
MSSSPTRPQIESTMPPQRGRPRSAHVEAAVFKAAMELLLEHGFEGMSMGQIAARAGVGKPAIYRRWPSKLAVVVAALSAVADPVVVPPDTGSTAGDLLAFVRLRQETLQRGGYLLLPRLVSELRTNPELRQPVLEHVVAPGRAPLRAIVERGIARGELRGDLDPELIVDLLAGPFAYRLFFGDDPARIGDDAPAMLAAVLEGIGRAPGHGPGGPDANEKGEVS